MRKIYRRVDITNMSSGEVVQRFGAVSGDAIIKADGNRVFILIPV